MATIDPNAVSNIRNTFLLGGGGNPVVALQTLGLTKAQAESLVEQWSGNPPDPGVTQPAELQVGANGIIGAADPWGMMGDFGGRPAFIQNLASATLPGPGGYMAGPGDDIDLGLGFGTAGRGVNGETGAGTIDPRDSRQAGSYAQYLAARGIQGLPGTPAQEFVGARAGQVRNIFDVNQQIRAAQALAAGQTDPIPPGDFSAFARSFNLAQGGLSQSALATLRAIGGTDPAALKDTGLRFGRTFDPLSGDVTSSPNLAGLQDLLRAGLAPSYGGRGARYISQNVSNLRDRFEVERLAGGQGTTGTFLDYLQNKFQY